ncbi:hypothetical protein BLNAU_9607 [Blattamonas nauphoetae]|uniref:Uncharacterized protein n=1 Tax=Blattamonas nauphoetae TaxID=2049346 RepID=A0ABQ9XV67_9EUKA|nr:hypothetical protein BLNAU_9607 [Blattamonas nauphoetae]
MSEQNSISHQSILSISIDCGNNNLTDSTLFQEIPTESLQSYIHRFKSRNESLSWTRLMEWFVEAAIGAELFRNEHPSAPPLSFENIRIDSSSTILIAFPSSQDEPSISGSLSSDISTLCKFFLHIHRTLLHQNRLILPLDLKQRDVVFSRIMVALIEHFVASGDLILQNSSPTDHSQSFANFYQFLEENIGESSAVFLPHILALFFTRFVIHPNSRYLILTDHSFLRGDDVQCSEQLLDAVKKIKDTHSHETVQIAFFDSTEWMTMMEAIEKDATLGNDLSFLQSRCLRPTLLSLQTKHQLIVNPPQIEENCAPDSPPFCMPDDLSLRSQAISAFTHLTLNRRSSFDHQTSSTDRSSFSSTISTQTALPSDQSSSDSQLLASEQMSSHPDSIVRHSKQILSAIHLHLTRPCHSSFPWDNRPSYTSDTELDASVQPTPQSIDESETFDISLFDETDDVKIVASLRRCCAVVDATQSTKCIVDIDTFRAFLISGLNSSNLAIQDECHTLFITTGKFLSTVADPHDQTFETDLIDLSFFDLRK